MKTLLWSTVILYSSAMSVCAEVPMVMDVTAEQRLDGGKELVISYDLYDADIYDCTVTLEIFEPGGSTFEPAMVTGDVGPGVTPGEDKTIVWDAMQEYPGRFSTQYTARITAVNSANPNEMHYTVPGTDVALLLVRVSEGTFRMGYSYEGDTVPVHEVFLDEYWIMKYEMTLGQWRGISEAYGYPFPVTDTLHPGAPSDYFTNPIYDSYPMVNIGWADAYDMAERMGLALPTEAQWEKAARGNDERTYPWGEELPGEPPVFRANLEQYDDGYGFTAPVDTYGLGVSPYGCWNMIGNVSEWCYDWYDPEYYYGLDYPNNFNPTGPYNGSEKVIRGGDWIGSIYNPTAWRRQSLPPHDLSNTMGVRLVLNP